MLASAVTAILASIVFIATDSGDRTFSILTFVFALTAAVVQLASVFLNFDFLAILPPWLYGVAVGIHIYTGIPTVTDIFTNVNFYGGNAWAVFTFGGIFLVCGVSAIVNCFLEQNKVKI